MSKTTEGDALLPETLGAKYILETVGQMAVALGRVRLHDEYTSIDLRTGAVHTQYYPDNLSDEFIRNRNLTPTGNHLDIGDEMLVWEIVRAFHTHGEPDVTVKNAPMVTKRSDAVNE